MCDLQPTTMPGEKLVCVVGCLVTGAGRLGRL